MEKTVQMSNFFAISLESTIKENFIRSMTTFLRKFIQKAHAWKIHRPAAKKKDKHWFFYSIRLDFGKDFLPPPALGQLLSRAEVTFQAVWLRWNIIKITLYIAQRKWRFARTSWFCCLRNDCKKKNSNPTGLAKLQENVRLCKQRSGKAHRKKDHPNSAPFSLRLGQSFARSPKKTASYAGNNPRSKKVKKEVNHFTKTLLQKIKNIA